MQMCPCRYGVYVPNFGIRFVKCYSNINENLKCLLQIYKNTCILKLMAPILLEWLIYVKNNSLYILYMVHKIQKWYIKSRYIQAMVHKVRHSCTCTCNLIIEIELCYYIVFNTTHCIMHSK